MDARPSWTPFRPSLYSFAAYPGCPACPSCRSSGSRRSRACSCPENSCPDNFTVGYQPSSHHPVSPLWLDGNNTSRWDQHHRTHRIVSLVPSSPSRPLAKVLETNCPGLSPHRTCSGLVSASVSVLVVLVLVLVLVSVQVHARAQRVRRNPHPRSWPLL